MIFSLSFHLLRSWRPVSQFHVADSKYRGVSTDLGPMSFCDPFPNPKLHFHFPIWISSYSRVWFPLLNLFISGSFRAFTTEYDMIDYSLIFVKCLVFLATPLGVFSPDEKRVESKQAIF